LNKKN